MDIIHSCVHVNSIKQKGNPGVQAYILIKLWSYKITQLVSMDDDYLGDIILGVCNTWQKSSGDRI